MDAQFLNRIRSTRFEELVAEASEVRRLGVGSKLEVCGIVNAKSGACSEDCKYCAQSSHHCVNILEYPLKSADELVRAAVQAKDNGAKRFGIVTSGNRLNEAELLIVAEAVRRMTSDVGIIPCASLGAISAEDFILLKNAGLRRYHHNIETSRSFYPSIVSTHDYDERVNTVKAAKQAGLEVCSGGIIGLGESWQDRLDMALLLKELDVDAVPLNILIPIKGTPLGERARMSPEEALRTIALFRFILKDKEIKVAAGRDTILKDYQALIFMAGANSIMVGGYLTVAGRDVADDKTLIREISELWNAR